MRLKDVTDDILREACAASVSWSAVMLRCGLNQGSRDSIKNRVRMLGIDVSHFLGQAYLRGRVLGSRKRHRGEYDLSRYLVEHSDYPRQDLKRRLLREGVLKNECAMCGQGPEWKGEPLVMVLDHVNGVRDDHRQENLRMLCPNCNSQTPTFCGRNTPRDVKVYRCSRCGSKISRFSASGLCRGCVGFDRGRAQRRVERPPIDELRKMVERNGFTGVAKQFGVTKSAVMKWSKA